MLRGEVWLTRFDSAIGGEIQKTRPAVIISNDYANAMLNRVQIVPTSSRIAKIHPSEAMISVGGQPSKAIADQMTTADKRRLLRRLGRLTLDEMTSVDRAIKTQLGLR
jgi:mRNA interferase MazF